MWTMVDTWNSNVAGHVSLGSLIRHSDSHLPKSLLPACTILYTGGRLETLNQASIYPSIHSLTLSITDTLLFYTHTLKKQHMLMHTQAHNQIVRMDGFVYSEYAVQSLHSATGKIKDQKCRNTYRSCIGGTVYTHIGQDLHFFQYTGNHPPPGYLYFCKKSQPAIHRSIIQFFKKKHKTPYLWEIIPVANLTQIPPITLMTLHLQMLSKRQFFPPFGQERKQTDSKNNRLYFLLYSLSPLVVFL